ncbi:MAG: hypothetical protein KAS32_29265 [Candidatus Peribacteraceae bacterium]|nr:hypothetical protein [Candidatus Peribacteraceae bacterium]
MYKAIVCRIKLFPHPNADKLVLGNAHGFQVIVGKDDFVDDQLCVFFPPDGQLSEEMCKANDLIAYKDPETHKRKGGYFSENRRVKSQNLRQQKSEGYCTNLEAFKFTKFNVSKLKEGDQFDELKGVPICNKYFTPATLKAMRNKTGVLRRANQCFSQHVETKQFKYVANTIPKGSILNFTEKLHGTSGRFGYVLDEVIKGKWKRFIHYILEVVSRYFIAEAKIAGRTEQVWDYLNGTRRTILAKSTGPSFYGNEEFRENVIRSLREHMHKGEVLYYEIVGYTTTGKSIMSSVATKKLKDKAITKKYGDTMNYKYGCVEGIADIYVYRITMVNDDGISFDLSWDRIKERCRVLGVKHVPEMAEPVIYDGDLDKLTEKVSEMMEGDSTVDASHIREGIVVRADNGNGTIFMKAKSHTFGVLEGFIKEDEDYVDMEEVA